MDTNLPAAPKKICVLCDGACMCFLSPKDISSWCEQLMLLFSHPHRRYVADQNSSYVLLTATAGKNGCVPHSFVANCYIRIPSRSSIMLYVSPPPCPFQSALSGWVRCSWLGLHLLCCLNSNLIGILRLLPFHCIPAAYACRAPMPLLMKPKSNSTMAKWSTPTSAGLMTCECDESFQTLSWSQLRSGKSRHRTAITLRCNPTKFRNSLAAPWRWRC